MKCNRVAGWSDDTLSSFLAPKDKGNFPPEQNFFLAESFVEDIVTLKTH